MILSDCFYYDGKPYAEGPKWCMSTIEEGSMRFRWNETNPNRLEFLSSVAGKREISQVELIHSKIVYDSSSSGALGNKQGDGIITANRNLMPVVTVADCMPIFMFDKVTGVFGVLHSGWKGTGICAEAISLASEKYGAAPENFSFVLGPHIHKCCYNVDKDRAEYFRTNFCETSISERSDGEYNLSLAEANVSVLLKSGVRAENITVRPECTCCHKENGSYKFGSFRRQNAAEGAFTVQAAFVQWRQE